MLARSYGPRSLSHTYGSAYILVDCPVFCQIAVMANKPKRRSRRFNLRRVRLTPELNLGTLASDTAITNSVQGGTSTNAMLIASIIATWNLNGLTAQEGPITVGYAHPDYSVTEIKECLEAAAAIDLGDKVAQERANRLIRIVGTLDQENDVLNNGLPVKTKLNWKLPAGQTPNMFAFNEQTGSLTTGATIKLAGNMWVRDSI